MTFDDYSNERLLAQGESRPARDRLAIGALGLGGESGEVTELIKKHLYHGRDLDRDKVIKELGDVLWYVMFMADSVGSSLREVAEVNNQKLRERYPSGFSVEAAAVKRPDEG
jgi:NTP pyrophosphatase (non-canonical NTP hydrolase)